MDIDKQIQQGIQNQASGARFGLNSIPRHIHNGTDSPPVFQTILTYIGAVNANGGIAIMPKGWGGSGGSGNYTIIHNLGSSAIYSVVATANDFLDSAVICTINQTANNFTVSTWNVIGVLVSCGFTFSLTVINNRSTTLPSYITL